MTSQLVANFACTIPAGTPQATPVAIPMNIQSRLVSAIRVRVPPGPRGNMGWQIGSNGQQIIPETPGSFLVWDNELNTWDLIDFPEGGSYQLIGYNTGQFAHTVYVTFELNPLTPTSAAPTTPPNGAALSSAPALPSEVPVVPSDGSTAQGATVAGVNGSTAPPAIPAAPQVTPPTITPPSTTATPVVAPPVLPTPPTF